MFVCKCRGFSLLAKDKHLLPVEKSYLWLFAFYFNLTLLATQLLMMAMMMIKLPEMGFNYRWWLNRLISTIIIDHFDFSRRSLIA